MQKPKTKKFSYKSSIPGIVVGKAHLITASQTAFPKYWINDREISSEIVRFKASIQKSKEQLNRIKEKMCKFRGTDQVNILESHSMLLQDEMLISHTVQTLTNQKINAEWALEKTLVELKLLFSDMTNEFFQERLDDIEYVGKRILKNLQGTAELNLDLLGKGKYILVINDLSPADVAALPRDKIEGFITSTGGATSHTAIIAKSLEIPAVLGRPDIVNAIALDDKIIVDGTSNEVIINPTKQALSTYQKQKLRYKKLEQRLIKTSHLNAKTSDGHQISVVANIELIDEVPSAMEHGAEGIGLYRTEFFYANKIEYPTEDELVENFHTVLKMMNPKPVTIRTLDLGGDKLFFSGEFSDHLNPALGLRAIRFSLFEKEMFSTQLRAMLRANKYGNLRIMLPMISTLEEVLQVKKILKTVEADLKKENKTFGKDYKFGIMIEVPSAVLIADILAKEVDFFSIGTNDLIQYTFAIDRTNENVSYLFQPLNPAILRMIAHTVTAANEAKIDVTVCGEMAGDPLYIMLLVGLGLGGLSMNPISIPMVKQIIRNLKYTDTKALAQTLLNKRSAAEIEKILAKKIRPIIGTATKRSKPPKHTKLK